MENKDLEPVESSELPLTSRESQPPLVVDLPDGQKLVVGDLDPGTVIEVATWRGTGRPDSRTNRFMLGVSTNEAEGIPSKRSLPNRAKVVESESKEQAVERPLELPAVTSSEKFVSNQIATGVIYANVNPESGKSQVATSNQSAKGALVKKVLFWLTSVAVIS